MKEGIKVTIQKSLDDNWTLISEEDYSNYPKGSSVAIITESAKFKLEQESPIIYKFPNWTDKKAQKLEIEKEKIFHLMEYSVKLGIILEEDPPVKRLLGVRKRILKDKIKWKYDKRYGLELTSGIILDNLERIVFDSFELPIFEYKFR